MASNRYSPLWFQHFMPQQTEEVTKLELAFLSRQLPLPRFRRVLDLCCGYGRHATGLAARGYQVTGLDRDRLAIAEATRRTLAAGQHVAYVVGDMRGVGQLPGVFDAIINMWASLTYFEEETNTTLLHAIGDKLSPGGRFIADLYHRGYCERHQGHQRQEHGGVTIESNGFMAGKRWHSLLTYRDAHGEELGSEHMEWQVFTPDEFSALADGCGFVPVRACTWADEGRPPSPDVARFQIVLERQ
jgi:SAM-dependent methyltransferase